LRLPTHLPPTCVFAVDDVLSRMRLDTKNIAGKLRFILPTRLGEVKLFDDIADQDVVSALEANE
jgi:3-dehydroquinate synthase